MEEQAAVVAQDAILYEDEDEESAGPVRTVKAETNEDGSPAYVYLDANPEIFLEDEFKCPICLGAHLTSQAEQGLAVNYVAA